MPKAARQSEPAAPAVSAEGAAGLTFEEAMRRLETVVEDMEAEDMPLENLLSKYAEGVALARTCQGKLNEADLKVRQLEKSLAGEPRLAPGEVAEQEP